MKGGKTGKNDLNLFAETIRIESNEGKREFVDVSLDEESGEPCFKVKVKRERLFLGQVERRPKSCTVYIDLGQAQQLAEYLLNQINQIK